MTGHTPQEKDLCVAELSATIAESAADPAVGNCLFASQAAKCDRNQSKKPTEVSQFPSERRLVMDRHSLRSPAGGNVSTLGHPIDRGH